MFAKLIPWFCVAGGGAVGSLARYALGLAAQRFSLSFPVGTLAANILGCLVIGGVMQVAAETEILSPNVRLLLATGFCGGFTTLSSMVYEEAQFFKDGEWFYGALYLGLTLTGAMLAFYAGMWLVRLLAAH